MAKVIVFVDNGKVGVIVPSSTGAIEDFIKFVPAGATHRIADDDSLPADRYWRDCWEWVDAEVAVNHSKAKEKKLKEIRKLRDVALAKLDGEELRFLASDAGKLKEVRQRKQGLRDATEPLKKGEFDSSTLEELKNYVPPALIEV